MSFYYHRKNAINRYRGFRKDPYKVYVHCTYKPKVTKNHYVRPYISFFRISVVTEHYSFERRYIALFWFCWYIFYIRMSYPKGRLYILKISQHFGLLVNLCTEQLMRCKTLITLWHTVQSNSLEIKCRLFYINILSVISCHLCLPMHLYYIYYLSCNLLFFSVFLFVLVLSYFDFFYIFF